MDHKSAGVPTNPNDPALIFVQEFSFIGYRPMMFYVPPCDQYEELETLIHRHGGLMNKFHECFTY